MRKYLISGFLILLLAACGTATESDRPSGEETTTPVAESTNSSAADNNTAQTSNTTVTTGTNPEEASIVRVQDHTIGAEEPVVTIIEYGDFQ
jgi:hypothetical protein